MESQNIPTRFLPAVRSSAAEIDQCKRALLKNPFLSSILDFVPVITLLLNKNRQIVQANKAVINIADLKGSDVIFGLRPGELVDCIHARETEGGCGTTEFCRVCGAANAILSSQNGQPDVRECRIIKTSGEAMDLRVWTSLFLVGDDKYTFFSVVDITDEKRRRWLERIFFHDVMNSVTGVLAAAEIIKDARPEDKDKMAEVIMAAGNRIVEEIGAQKDLTAAETGELKIDCKPLSSTALLKDIAALYEQSHLCRNKKVVVGVNEDITFSSDRRLLFRVISNMTKNALEATPEGAVITLMAERIGDRIKLSVNNPGTIPEDVCLQIFQRSFSTKAGDRGLGTYSMKLLSERYLKGKVSFTTQEAQGTTFIAEYPINPA